MQMAQGSEINEKYTQKTWELERYLLGELPLQRMEEIKKLVEENPELKKGTVPITEKVDNS